MQLKDVQSLPKKARMDILTRLTVERLERLAKEWEAGRQYEFKFEAEKAE